MLYVLVPVAWNVNIFNYFVARDKFWEFYRIILVSNVWNSK